MIEANIQLSKAQFELRVEFKIPSRGVTGIFGPSGCGKTSLLRAIAGLEPDTKGSLSVGGETWMSPAKRLKVEKRGVGFVFQSPSLFAHLSVEENIRFGRKRLRKIQEPIEYKELIEMLELENMLHRYPHGLSGGEAQRVALGRTLLAEPRLLLMDEPLSALDQGSRENMMSLLEKFLQHIEIPVLYVTHSSEEVARLADSLVLLKDGRVSQSGPIRQVLGALDGDLGRSDSAFSVIEGVMSGEDLPGLTTVDCGEGIRLHIPRAGVGSQQGDRVRLRIRAKDVSLCLERPEQTSILNILPARVEELAAGFDEGSWTVKLAIGGSTLLSRISAYSVQQLELVQGQSLFAQIKSVSLI